MSDDPGFDALAELALDMRRSWNHATDEARRRLDPELWEAPRVYRAAPGSAAVPTSRKAA